MKQLIIYGDSILRGVTYSEEKKAHTLVRGYKLEEVEGIGFAVKNRSRMGATVGRGLDLLTGDIEAGADFLSSESSVGDRTYILLEYGGNDCDFEWREIIENPQGSFSPRTTEEKFRDLYGKAIEKAKSAGARVILSTMIPIDAERYLRWISRQGGYEEILGWLGDVSMLYRFQEHYSRIVEEIARAYDCPLIDTREAFLLSHEYRDLLCYDGIHPTERGHELIEKTLCDFLKKVS